jgi:hypothetical protein
VRHGSVDSKTEAMVAMYLASLVNERLRKHVPGLQLSLNMFMYSMYGKYPGELIYSDPKAFMTALRKYFRDPDVAVRLVKYILKPLEDCGEEGREALRALLDGRWDDFKRLAMQALKNKARKWAKS